jgi:hypothetical protein
VRKLSAADLCDLVYWWLTQEMDEKQKARVDVELSIPPAGTALPKDDPIWSADAEMQMFKKATGK